MSLDEKTVYPRLAEPISADELVLDFTPTEEEIEFSIRSSRQPASRLTLFSVTSALATRAPEESETEPENDAVEASVWLWATGRAMLRARLATASNRRMGKFRNLGINRALLGC